MTFEFRPAVRENVPLLIGLAGGTGSGKTFSAMRNELSGIFSIVGPLGVFCPHDWRMQK